MDDAAAAVWRMYRDRIFARLEQVEAGVSAALAGRLGEEARDEARREAHKLAGVLGTLGMPEGTHPALTLENALHRGAPYDAAELTTATTALRALLESRP